MYYVEVYEELQHFNWPEPQISCQEKKIVALLPEEFRLWGRVCGQSRGSWSWQELHSGKWKKQVRAPPAGKKATLRIESEIAALCRKSGERCLERILVVIMYFVLSIEFRAKCSTIFQSLFMTEWGRGVFFNHCSFSQGRIWDCLHGAFTEKEHLAIVFALVTRVCNPRTHQGLRSVRHTDWIPCLFGRKLRGRKISCLSIGPQSAKLE